MHIGHELQLFLQSYCCLSIDDAFLRHSRTTVQAPQGNSMVALHHLVESHWGTRGQEYQHITLGTQRRLEQDY